MEGVVRRVVLPDGILVELFSQEDYEKLVQKYQEEGYEILEQGDLIIITTKPKQASSLSSFSEEKDEYLICAKYEDDKEICEQVDEDFISSFSLSELVEQLFDPTPDVIFICSPNGECEAFENIYKNIFA